MMVGVPRSRGCRSCRRKKKGCDLVKPVCGQCARLHLPCGWDDKQYTFVHQEPGPAALSAKLVVRSRSIPELRRPTPTPSPDSQAALTLTRTASELGAVDNFWSRFLPRDEPQAVDGVIAGSWVRTVQDLAVFDQTVNTSLNACALTALGRVNADHTLLQEGRRVYANALRETNRALQCPITAQSDAVLASCKLLSVYESFRFDSGTGISTQAHDWHRHIEGTCRIVELRGPAKHVSNHGHALFEEARITAAIAGMAKRKSNSFTSVAWYTVPWETSPRNIKDELCDVMIALPDILSKQDALTQRLSSLETNSDLYSLLTDGQQHISHCILLAKSLQAWEQKALMICLEKTSDSPANFAGPLTLLEVCKDFGYGFFHMVNVYFAACVILYSSTWVAKRNLETAARERQWLSLPKLMQLPDLPAWMTPRPFASNIVKCASHYFTEQAGLWGPMCATFPMGTALHYYAAIGGHDSDDMHQLRRLLGPGKSEGAATDFLRSMANTSDARSGDPADLQEHSKMASSWYGIDHVQRSPTSATAATA